MSRLAEAPVPLGDTGRFFIDGDWVKPSTDSVFDVIDSATEQPYFRVAEAQAMDMDLAIGAARHAFDRGSWPRMTHAERATYLQAMADELEARAADYSAMWPHESGVLYAFAQASEPGIPSTLRFYADLAADFPFEEEFIPSSTTLAGGGYGLLVREPVGVVGAIIPWNAPLPLALIKVAPALLAGCVVIVKVSPEAPGAGYLLAEVAERVGLPRGVLNVLTADREVSELLVRDHRVDKIAFTGSTAAGRRIGEICGGRIARCTLELGGKSAAVILDDADIGVAAATLAGAECFLSGQVCASLTRIVVPRHRHDEFADALAAAFSAVQVGDPFDPTTQMGPLAMERQRDRVEHYIAKGVEQGATLLTGGGRPKHLDRGFYIEPTVFAGVDNKHVIAQEEIFGPVLSVIPADNDEHAVDIANDTIYGLNAAVFTPDAARAREVAGRLRSGTVGHNGMRIDMDTSFGGVKQSGVGREGGREGLLPYLETKTVLLDAKPT
ncbi:aldehyde dehydrogenase [Mycolicibacterium sp. ND9-15]|uniref:aldehyde dehydrogenase n=1 Tax=Mycolicibacterium sp. ND9-15 TaxID=3042320 RepID=UPI002DD7C0D1|nr:aldehyde dehydrogenase [Mycolicibacterium sp. ND9-15]WSE56555.1 aldehyde dehydrogenase [Mycolicibacterium sp. ND9-15]